MTRFLLGYFLLAVPAFGLFWACCRAGAQADAAMGLRPCEMCGETTDRPLCARCEGARICPLCRRAGCDGSLSACQDRWR